MSKETQQLVASRVTVPPADARLLVRARLNARLDQAAGHRLVYIRAPAGFGKTSLVSAWAARSAGALQVAWVSLNESHADARTLLRYVVAALRSVAGPIGEATLTLLNAGVPINAEALLTTLCNELGALTRPVCLVLDDVHCLARGEAANCVAELVRGAPAGLHFVLASRAAAPFALGRLRQLGHLIEISSKDLEFTEVEVSAFLEREALVLSAAQAHALTRNTGGWAAGLRLAAIGLRDKHAGAAFIDSFSGGHTVIAEFLQEDVFSRQSAELQAFLLEAGVLDEFSAADCDDLLHRCDSRALLSDACERGLFLHTVDPHGERFSFHHLFAGFLRQRIARDQPAVARAILARASERAAHEGAHYAAVDYALRAGQPDRAADLLEAFSEILFSNGQLESLHRFAQRLPDELIDSHPSFALDLIWIHTLNWETAAAEALMRRIKAALPAQQDNAPAGARLREKIVHREIMIALLQDRLSEAETLWEQWPMVTTNTNSYFDGSAETSVLLARRERFDCRFVTAQSPRVRRRFLDAGAEFGTIWFDCLSGPAWLMNGDGGRAVETFRAAIKVATRIGGADSALLAMPSLLLADVLYQHAEIEACRALIERWLPHADQIGFVDQLIAGFSCAVRLAALDGDQVRVVALLGRADELAAAYEFERLAIHLLGERVHQLVRAGHAREARELLAASPLARAPALAPPRSLATVSDFVIVLAHCRCAQEHQHMAQAVRALRAWCNFLDGHGCVPHAISARLVLAGLLLALDESREAWRVLRAALEQAQASGLVQALYDEGQTCVRVLDLAHADEALTGDALATQVARLRRQVAGDRSAAAHGLHRARPRAEAGHETLSDRQREILSCIADGSSNKEVAARLGVTEATIKWHLQQAYARLGVHRRIAAVRQARARGLIA